MMKVLISVVTWDEPTYWPWTPVPDCDEVWRLDFLFPLRLIVVIVGVVVAGVVTEVGVGMVVVVGVVVGMVVVVG